MTLEAASELHIRKVPHWRSWPRAAASTCRRSIARVTVLRPSRPPSARVLDGTSGLRAEGEFPPQRPGSLRSGPGSGRRARPGCLSGPAPNFRESETTTGLGPRPGKHAALPAPGGSMCPAAALRTLCRRRSSFRLPPQGPSRLDRDSESRIMCQWEPSPLVSGSLVGAPFEFGTRTVRFSLGTGKLRLPVEKKQCAFVFKMGCRGLGAWAPAAAFRAPGVCSFADTLPLVGCGRAERDRGGRGGEAA